jgi:hypothetical protein
MNRHLSPSTTKPNTKSHISKPKNSNQTPTPKDHESPDSPSARNSTNPENYTRKTETQDYKARSSELRPQAPCCIATITSPLRASSPEFTFTDLRQHSTHQTQKMDIVDEEGVSPRVLTSSVEESLLMITNKCALLCACGGCAAQILEDSGGAAEMMQRRWDRP